MAKVFHFYVPYGQAVVLPFTADAPLTSGARQTCITGATGPVTADISISKDGAALGAPAGTITQVGTKLYTYNATAADMSAQRIMAIISDNAGAAYDDVTIHIETRLATQFYGDASAAPGAANGFHGIGTATGKPCNWFDTVLGVEPTAAFNALTSTVGEFLQHLLARWFHVVITSGTQQIVYKRDDSTALDTMTVTPTGSTVTKGRAT